MYLKIIQIQSEKLLPAKAEPDALLRMGEEHGDKE